MTSVFLAWAGEHRVGLRAAAALCAFAGNSLLTRLALGQMTIDAATFATVRLASGAAMLVVVTAVTRSRTRRVCGSWLSASALFLYAVPYSYAYVSLTAGTGTLILIGSVQITMMRAALLTGERPRTIQWLGLSLAFVGLVYLVLPGLAAPSLVGSFSMALAGIAWSGYSLLIVSAIVVIAGISLTLIGPKRPWRDTAARTRREPSRVAYTD